LDVGESVFYPLYDALLLIGCTALTEAVKADHGFTSESQAIHDLISVMSEFEAPARRQFLQFITGSPKLPIGGIFFAQIPRSLGADGSPSGFRGLNPPLTVVRKPHEPPLVADDYLPSVMTCVNYLKLPEYSTRAVMKTRLQTAAKEGIHSGFHLS
jgi:E3 ubiquitin-protein ligase TRIP12